MDALVDGQLPPEVRVPRVLERSRALMTRAQAAKAPMGPRAQAGRGLVYARARGCNVWDVEGNRYVDLCAGFGALLLGHGHPALTSALGAQATELQLALGDVYDSEPKILLLERIARLLPTSDVRGILGLSGADAVTAAIKTCVLATGRSRLIAFEGSYHGLSYAPLAISGLRSSYREPFSAQLNPHVTLLPFPDSRAALDQLALALAEGDVGGVVVEPILGRGGVRPLEPEHAGELARLTRAHGALLVADEVWTGLGRSGAWLWSLELGVCPDLVCLGKGLGGGLPVSACIGTGKVMASWQQEAEVVHTQTHAGAPLGASVALALLSELENGGWVERARSVGIEFEGRLRQVLSSLPVVVRGEGLMLGLDLGGAPGAAVRAAARLLDLGFIVSTGGGSRDTVVLTPPLIIDQDLLECFARVLPDAIAVALEG